MPTNDEINWEINEPIISRYGIQTWKNGKRSPDHLVDVHHTGISLNYMLNEARADTVQQIFAELDKIIHGKGSTEIILRNKHVIFFGFKEYEAVKKKHKAD
jgi:hypothetical protein